ncbi:MAG: transcriptional regulator [Kiritimatiellae bacterium]|nr:transcriptional regulator [Kiritimatiellia bacterium]
MNFEQQVDAMLEELADNPGEVKAALARARLSNAVVRALQRARLDAGYSQRELAKAAGFSPAKASRMESGQDDDLKLGDVRQYLAALGMSMHMTFEDESKPAAYRIKQKVIEIGFLLASLANLAEKDPEDRPLVDGINRFRGEVLFNFMLRYAETRPQITIAPPAREPAPELQTASTTAEPALVPSP